MDLRPYETVVILDPDLSDENKEALLSKVKSIIEGKGGEVEKLERWGVRELAYPIQKKDKGEYYIIQYRAVPGTVNEMEDYFRVTEGFMRFLSVVRKEKKEG